MQSLVDIVSKDWVQGGPANNSQEDESLQGSDEDSDEEVDIDGAIGGAIHLTNSTCTV